MYRNVLLKKRKHRVKEQLTKKRRREPEKWKRNITKTATNLGLAYTSSSTTKNVAARKLKVRCGPGCKSKCEQKVSEEKRAAFFADYWEIGDQSKKYNFICRHVSEHLRKESTKESKREYTRTYSISYRNQKITVCRLMFLNTLSISKQVITTALKKARNGEKLEDKRGTSKNSVVEHINLFSHVNSYYTRKNSNREYLEEGLCLSKMFRLYQQWTKENGKSSKHHYYDVFNTKFNISFFHPKKDQCDQCVGYENATAENKKALETKYVAHISNKEKARSVKKGDEEIAKNARETTSMIIFDFQKVLSTPKSEASSLYCKRKLSVYNFTIFYIARHEGYCYVWRESDAKKGSNEVATCLLHYIEKRVVSGVTDFLL